MLKKLMKMNSYLSILFRFHEIKLLDLSKNEQGELQSSFSKKNKKLAQRFPMEEVIRFCQKHRKLSNVPKILYPAIRIGEKNQFYSLYMHVKERLTIRSSLISFFKENNVPVQESVKGIQIIFPLSDMEKGFFVDRNKNIEKKNCYKPKYNRKKRVQFTIKGIVPVYDFFENEDIYRENEEMTEDFADFLTIVLNAYPLKKDRIVDFFGEKIFFNLNSENRRNKTHELIQFLKWNNVKIVNE